MYRLNLDDQKLYLPVPVYLIKSATGKYDYQLREQIASNGSWDRIIKIAFFALPPDRKLSGLIPVYKKPVKTGSLLSLKQSGSPLCYVVPADVNNQKLITGNWDLQMNNLKFFDNQFGITILSDTEVRPEDNKFIIPDFGYENSNLQITLNYNNQIYNLTGIQILIKATLFFLRIVIQQKNSIPEKLNLSAKYGKTRIPYLFWTMKFNRFWMKVLISMNNS